MTATTAPRPHLPDPVAWQFPAFDHDVLGPGLELHHRHLPGRPLVAVDLLLDAPITVEPSGHEGVAVITARALDEGSSTRDGDAFAAALDRQGAHLSTGVSTSGTRVSLEVPAPRLPAALALLAEAVLDPVFPDREVDRLVRQRLDAIRQQYARPEQRAGIAVREALVAADHRCHRATGGEADTVATVDRDLATAFHAEHLLTGPATLVVGGDLSGLDVPALATDHLAPFAAPDRGAHAVVPLATVVGPRTVVVDKPGAVQTQLVVARPGPDRHAPDWVPTRVAAFVLGGTLTSRLDMVLREDKGYTYGIRTRLQTFRAGGLTKLAEGSVHTEVTAEAVTTALDIMRRFAHEGPSADELEATVDYLSGVRPLSLETAQALVHEVTRNLHDGLSADHTDAELAALREVDVEAVARAAAAHLDPTDTVIVAVGDADAITAPLEAIGHGPVEVVTDDA